jgi:hypothetical protein
MMPQYQPVCVGTTSAGRTRLSNAFDFSFDLQRQRYADFPFHVLIFGFDLRRMTTLSAKAGAPWQPQLKVGQSLP